MIIRARTVVSMDAPPIENGGIVLSKTRIVDVGKFDEIKVHHSGEVIDLGEQALLPGFINAHCHLDYTCLRGKIPSQRSFTDWIRAINAEKATLSPNDYLASIAQGFREAKKFGTTTVANLTAFPEMIPHIEAPIRTSWFPELIDVRMPGRARDLVEFALESLNRARRPDEVWGLAPHALFTASKELYMRCEEIARQKNALMTTHLAESREEMEMFKDASGALYEFLKSIGRSMDDCGNKTPLEHFLHFIGSGASPNASRSIEVNRPCHSWIVVHLNEVAETDFELLQRSVSKFDIVHCPRSHNYFGHRPFEFKRLRSLGLNICLGTDSLASNEDLSLFAEMRAFQKAFPSVSPEAILRMVTVNPAMALDQENALGRIRRGFEADLIAVPCSGLTDVFEQIIAFDSTVSWAMVIGECE
ncbi:MAG TPA: amidohydrolase family protein [Candidatus Udaeobacter sp.]|jgi:cytosine/adenosine deaminase-related metal-dependent hydrolase|nr:amidohydrolase family protein [Candidatus Udaeobacter sp.]